MKLNLLKTEQTPDELAFLPAALEIQDTPPLPVSRYILWAILLFFSIAIAWACIGEVDIVGVAQGKIIPGGKVKVIQPLEPGVVSTILVKEGELVHAGQVLVELDATLTGADSASIKEQLLSLKLDRARLKALVEKIQGASVDPRSLSPEHFQALTEATPAQISLQTGRLHTQLNDYYARSEALKEEHKQRAGERAAVSGRIQQLDATLPLITERAGALEGLMKKNMVPRVQWLELEQERIEQVKERDVQKSTLISVDAAMATITQRLTAQQAEFSTKLLQELTDTENHIAALEQENIKAEQRMTLQKLTAPVAGKVHQLTVYTIGGVVTPAQELMHIVPDDGDIEVEAWLPNKDIGFVEDGQDAVLKIETFPFTLYGTINGEVLHVSNDATPDERLGLVYAMRVKMHQTTMRIKDKLVNLTPGMAVTVEVNMGKRKLIEFLLSPLLKYKNEAVRER